MHKWSVWVFLKLSELPQKICGNKALSALPASPHHHTDQLCHLLGNYWRMEGEDNLLSLPFFICSFVVSTYNCHTSFTTALSSLTQKHK